MFICFVCLFLTSNNINFSISHLPDSPKWIIGSSHLNIMLREFCYLSQLSLDQQEIQFSLPSSLFIGKEYPLFRGKDLIFKYMSKMLFSLMICSAFFDIVYLTCSVIVFSAPLIWPHLQSNFIFNKAIIIILPLANMGLTGNIYFIHKVKDQTTT